MEQIVKQTREVGTSAGVLLPRGWLGKEVVVTLKDLSQEEITRRVLDILLEKGVLEDVRGIYLIGSYARGEQEFDSDIDVLVITGKTSKVIVDGDFEITLVKEENLRKNLAKSLYYLVAITEGIALINKGLIEELNKVKPKLEIGKLIKEIEGMYKLNKMLVEDDKEDDEKVLDGTSYSIVLRLRELYLINCLMKNKKLDWKRLKGKINGNVYSAYLRIKKNKKDARGASADEVMDVLELSEKWLNEVKGLRKR